MGYRDIVNTQFKDQIALPIAKNGSGGHLTRC